MYTDLCSITRYWSGTWCQQATVSRTVDRVVNSIVAQSNEWIKFPTTNHELMEAKRISRSMYKFPTAIGVIDCTHIGILKPNRHGYEYINRKEKRSLNVQCTCDVREMFTSVDVSWPGSVHDSRIWRNSQTRSQLINKANVALLGDDGYGIGPCLMTPFRNPTPGAEINYTTAYWSKTTAQPHPAQPETVPLSAQNC
ncbi:unnamed protein product [Acanthoscelides obtectus]|uniref:Putative nuclease HARBI1 n=1 Tax=Acanthoscelides obtectus TaxID=200917 RepID=A0A9P0Q6M1_ACAOB|nr:unnamed protein product [Acanthoscelides obtectus]CAK1629771.1 Putative nuclease HARBI1 [Acanthoscelides obtectus]